MRTFLPLVLLLTFLSRLRFFVEEPVKLIAESSDAAWWWGVQHRLLWGERLTDTTFNFTRVSFRPPLDIGLQKGILFLDSATSLDLFQSNLITVVLVAIGALISLLFLVKAFWKSPFWISLSVVVISQSLYFKYLRYPIFTPKMLGFAYYPMMILVAWQLVHSPNARHKWLLSLFLALCGLVYFPTFLYVMPPLFIAIAIHHLPRILRGEISWRESASALGVIFIVGCVVVAITKWLILKSALGTPSEDIMSIFYPDLYLNLGNFLGFCRDYVFYLLFATCGVVGLTQFSNHVPSKTRSAILFLYILGVTQIALALFFYALAIYLPLIRTLWLWRMAYYSVLPLTLSGLLAVSSALLYGHSPVIKNLARLVCILFVTWVVLDRAATYSFPTKIVSDLTALWSAPSKNLELEEIRRLIEFVNTETPPKARVLMPSSKVQIRNLNLDLFDGELQRETLLAHSDRALVLISMPETELFASGLKKYRALETLPPGSAEFRNGFWQLAQTLRATHSIQENSFVEALGSDRRFTVAFKGQKWSILTFFEDGK